MFWEAVLRILVRGDSDEGNIQKSKEKISLPRSPKLESGKNHRRTGSRMFFPEPQVEGLHAKIIILVTCPRYLQFLRLLLAFISPALAQSSRAVRPIRFGFFRFKVLLLPSQISPSDSFACGVLGEMSDNFETTARPRHQLTKISLWGLTF